MYSLLGAMVTCAEFEGLMRCPSAECVRVQCNGTYLLCYVKLQLFLGQCLGSTICLAQWVPWTALQLASQKCQQIQVRL